MTYTFKVTWYWGMNWICFFWIPPTQKPYTRHQNCICTIYSSGEKWTCIICRPSWTPSWIFLNCQGLRGDTIIFLETGYLLKRLTPLAYLYHPTAHGNTSCCWTKIATRNWYEFCMTLWQFEWHSYAKFTRIRWFFQGTWLPNDIVTPSSVSYLKEIKNHRIEWDVCK